MTELLSPAGSYDSLVAAVNAGANAVYMGGSRFGARAYADNPDEDLFIQGLHYAHRYGAKVYMTVNTLFKERELEELPAYLRPYYEEGVDAVLVQDLGALKVIKDSFPYLPIHASTQMTVGDVYATKLLKSLGIERVVPARELSLAEIKKIKSAGIEVETFVYGALCYSYSGQCFMSSLIGGRSGNRGRCAQSCRLDYEACGECGKLLSLKDLNALTILPDLVDAGIDSFKIEGRMKSPRYTAGVTSIWRKYLDLYQEEGRQRYKVSKEDTEMLRDLFDRGGTTEGYYYQHNGPDMMAWDEKKYRVSQEELYSYLDEKYVYAIRKIKLHGSCSITVGEPMQLSVWDDSGNIAATVTGSITEEATGRPATEADIRKQLQKTGGTAYEWEDLAVNISGSAFVPVSGLNELRRTALEKVEEVIQSEYKRTL